jgi:HlyD family secretion protein
MQSMTPEERERFLQRRREWGGGGEGMGSGQGARQAREGDGERQGRRPAEQGQGQGSQPVRPLTASSAQTIDSLFGPLPVTESNGLVWLYVADQLRPVRVRLGISDGTYTELIAGDLEPGAEVVSSVILAAQAGAGTPGRSPLMGPSRGPGGPGGGPPGGGRPSGR